MSKFIISGFSDEISADFDTQLSEIKKMKIAYIEIRGVDERNITSYSLDEVKNIKKRLDKSEIKISAIGSPIGKINIQDDFDDHFELFKHTVEIAKILNTNYIRMFSFFMDTNDANIYRDEVIRRIKKMVDYVKGSNIVLLHENEKEIYGDIPERCMDLYNEIGCDNFKLIFDPANYIQCGVETYPHAFSMTKNVVIYYHIKDAITINGQVVPAGMGDGRLKAIISELHNDNYEGFLSLEPHLGSFEGLSNLEKKIGETQMQEVSDVSKFILAKEHLDEIIGEIQNG